MVGIELVVLASSALCAVGLAGCICVVLEVVP